MTALCHMARIKNVSIKIEAETPISLDVTGDLMETQIFGKGGGGLGSVRDLLFAKWNEGEMPTAPGTHERVEFVANPVQVYSLGGYTPASVFATMEVAESRYVGEFSEAQAAVIEGRSEDEVEMPDIPNAWEELAEGEAAPETEAVFTSVMQY
jgi:hypothetical protein